MTTWRILRYRPGKAHLWQQHGGPVWHSCCRRMAVVDLPATTHLVKDEPVLKCKQCLTFEIRQEAA